ncbi:uncharacterized protein N7496_009879 [Penicillium cataractarum]|uniref:Uncharacterized protein n=1 Tax=Penicillium cataractarum TaxID=2100454 RepID=A0A9W9V2V2_9EURO|nr:uncharacterized protein N7496_009879 [Penicillium cataractarum]KAJ5364166.1 hypothetical protein N7496_009879 [Penicillium cataractarum]
MGLIKTGLTLAGGYGLIKAASKAVNDYEVKKQRRSNQPQNQHQQQYPGHEPQMGYMQGNQTYHNASQPQWSSSTEPQYHHGNHTSNNLSREVHPRIVGDNSRSYAKAPPPYYQGQVFERQGDAQPGSAQEYYSGKKL